MKFDSIVLAFAIFAFSSAFAHAAPKSTPELIEKGKAAYKLNCAACHGDKLDGNGPAGQFMKPKPRDLVKAKYVAGDSAQKIFNTVSKGLPGTTMTGYAHLSEQDRWGIVFYIESQRKSAK